MPREGTREFCEIDPGKRCTNCGDCDYCDLVVGKICDNCCRCIGMDKDFVTVIVRKPEGDPLDELEDIPESTSRPE